MSEALINAINHVRTENELVTIYVKNGFGSITKLEGKLVELYSRVKYAQYSDAVKRLQYLQHDKYDPDDLLDSLRNTVKG